jgi:hypothetical protein
MYNYEELPTFQAKLAQLRGEALPEEKKEEKESKEEVEEQKAA